MRSCNDIMRSRIRFQACLLVIFFLYLIVRLYWVQIHDHDLYYREARAKYVASKTTSGIRGEIFDRDGHLFIGNMPCQDITITPCNIKVQDDKRVAAIISRTLKLDFDEVYAKVANKTRTVRKADGTVKTMPRQYAMIARNIPLPQSRKLKALLTKYKVARDVHFHDTYIRYYPKGKLLANVLGFTTMSHDKVQAVMGVEKVFNPKLRSATGKTVYERTRDGKQLGDSPLSEERSRDGMNLYLTISEPLQAILEEELDKACAKWNPKAVYAIMADPATGNILAMAQRPSFDPNERSSQDQPVDRRYVRTRFHYETSDRSRGAGYEDHRSRQPDRLRKRRLVFQQIPPDRYPQLRHTGCYRGDPQIQQYRYSQDRGHDGQGAFVLHVAEFWFGGTFGAAA